MVLGEVVWARYTNFATRLQQCLEGLQATGQPEVPRIVGHTLRLLNLLRDAWTQPINSPRPALELGWETNTLRLVLYGEPYAHHTLQHCGSLGVSNWSNTTNLHNEEFITPAVSEPKRFYRAQLPMP